MANTAAINIDADIKDLTDSLKQMTAAFKSENDAIQMQFQTIVLFLLFYILV